MNNSYTPVLTNHTGLLCKLITMTQLCLEPSLMKHNTRSVVLELPR